MRLTALCVCGTLLAFSSLSWTTADSGEGDLLGDQGFGPCVATLRLEGPCRPGQDENTCPYLLSLPPLTVHLPAQLRELEKIVKDLQTLKDNVDQLREMCADCTVSQTERECGRQREHAKLNESRDRHEDERNWVNERKPERIKEFRHECGPVRVKVENTMEGDGDTDSEKRTILEERGRKKWEAERGSDKVVVKENEKAETSKEVAEKNGKTQTERAKGKDKVGQKKVPTAGGNERERVVEKNNRETGTERNKEKGRKLDSKGDQQDKLESGKERKTTAKAKNKEKTEEGDHHVWRDETKETDKKTQTEEDRASDGIKMSEDHEEHTNKEREQHGEERKKEIKKGIKVERNNEKAKQTESIGRAEKEKTIKEGEREEEDGETGKEIKTEGEKAVQSVQRDSDGELTSNKAIERTDFVSISPTPQSTTSLAQRRDSEDSTSSLPSPLLSRSHLVADVNQRRTIAAYARPTQTDADFEVAGISEYPRPDAEAGSRTTRSTTTATMSTLGGPGQQVTSATTRFTSITSPRPWAGFQGQVSPITAATTTTTPSQNLYTIAFPGVTGRNHWTSKNNISSNTKTGVKPLPGRGQKPGEKHKPGIKPQANQKRPRPVAEAGLKTTTPTTAATISILGGPGQQVSSATTWFTLTATPRPGAGFQGRVSSTTTTTTTATPSQNLYTITFPGVTDRNRWTAKKNISSNTNTSVKPLPGRGQKPGEKHKPGIEPEANQKRPRPDAEAGFRTTRLTTTATMSTLGGPGQQVTSAISRFTSITSPRPGPGFQGLVSSTTATTTTTTPSQNSYTTTFPGVTDHDHWTAKKNISSNTKTGVKPLPGRGPKPGEKHKPGIKPEAKQKLKNPKNKPDQAPLSDKKTKHNQKQKPSSQKPTADQKPKPDKNPQQVQIPKPDQRTPLYNLTTDQNQKNNPIHKHDRDSTTDQNKLSVQKPKSQPKSIPPVQRPTSNQRPVTVDTTGFDKDPLTDKEHESDEIPVIHQNSKSEKKPHRPLKTDKPDQKQKPEKKPKSEEKPKPDQRSDPNQHFTSVQEPASERTETTIFTPKPNQKYVTESVGNSDENLTPEPKSNQDSTPGQKLTLDRIDKPSDKKPKPRQKIPGINQNPKSDHTPKLNQTHPELATGHKTKPNVKPKPGQTPQTNPGLKTPRPGQKPNLNPKSVPEEIPEAESKKATKPRPPPRHRPPTGPTLKPGATFAQRPKPAVQLKPSPKTKADSDPPRISGTTSDGIQNSHTDVPPTSGPVKQTAGVTHSPGDTEFSPSTRKTITLGPKTSNSLETEPFPRLHTLPEGFTMSPNSRITSDLRPQTASQPSSIPMTTRPNKIIRGILPSVIPSTSPGSTKLHVASNRESSSQAKILHNVEETTPRQTPYSDKMTIPVPSAGAQTTSTLSPDSRSTTPDTSAPEPPAAESSTPSARELRVKINQVAAFLNNSMSPSGRSLDKHPKEQPEDKQGGSRPDSKLPPRITSKVTTVMRDCSDHLLRGQTKSGVYLVTPDIRSKSFPASCDMELRGGGWTLLQRRQDGSVSFNRSWAEYRSGFGELDGGEFWLGNNMIHLLTRDRDMLLRVELEDFDGVMEYAEYEQFKVASERLRYRLTVGGYSGTAGDALRFSKRYDHNNRMFTTPDRDNDRYPSGNCGAYYSSGWWFDACMAANLNGRYYVGKYTGVRDGIYWGTWHNISTEYYPTNERRSFKTVRMMIRPKGFAP